MGLAVRLAARTKAPKIPSNLLINCTNLPTGQTPSLLLNDPGTSSDAVLSSHKRDISGAFISMSFRCACLRSSWLICEFPPTLSFTVRILLSQRWVQRSSNFRNFRKSIRVAPRSISAICAISAANARVFSGAHSIGVLEICAISAICATACRAVRKRRTRQHGAGQPPILTRHTRARLERHRVGAPTIVEGDFLPFLPLIDHRSRLRPKPILSGFFDFLPFLPFLPDLSRGHTTHCSVDAGVEKIGRTGHGGHLGINPAVVNIPVI
jgi:hypothetical protein